jgi:hypothetical protein
MMLCRIIGKFRQRHPKLLGHGASMQGKRNLKTDCNN